MQIKKWMNANNMKLNEEKTELIIIGSKRNKTKVESIKPKKTFNDFKSIYIVRKVKILDRILDSSLTMDALVMYIFDYSVKANECS